jgi:hypothetical protein
VLKKGLYDRRLIAHELTHVMQYERFGGTEAFLKEYVKEVAFPPGYPHGPLESEAAQMADRICQNPSTWRRKIVEPFPLPENSIIRRDPRP